MNRGIEIDSNVADGVQSVIREQVEMGVAVRMAVLDALARNLPGGRQRMMAPAREAVGGPQGLSQCAPHRSGRKVSTARADC